MNFEDIVDMEWVDSSTTLDQSNEFSDLYFNQQLLQPQTTTTIEEPQIKLESLSTMPSTEQIKQLIEIAKQQLALREQLQSLVQHQNTTTTTTTTTTTPDLFQFLSNPNETEIQTAAPSTIFAPPPSDQTPFIPPPPTTDTTQSLTIDDVTTASTTTSTTKARRDSIHSIPEESISLEAYAEADGIDLKKLTPKERRQLRNKISARNFRVRRKEYISTLEGQVNEHKQKAEALKEKLIQAEDENKQLRKEMDSLKRQNQILQQTIPKPNLNKDISILGTKATDSYRQQQHVLVSSAVMPAWDYKAILEKPIGPDYHDMNKLAGHFILSVVRLAKTMPTTTITTHKKPLLPDDRDFSKHRSITTAFSSSSSSLSLEDLYDTLIHSALLNSSSTADKSFLW